MLPGNHLGSKPGPYSRNVVFSHIAALQEEASILREEEPSSGVLATAGLDMQPSARTVTFQILQSSRLVFFVGEGTAKARNLREQARASLCIHWKRSGIQIAIDGIADVLPLDVAEQAWGLRSRDSQIAAHAVARCATSERSLLSECRAVEREFSDRPIPRPASWTGHEMHPDRVIIWQTGWDKPHLRQIFTCVGGDTFELGHERP